VWPSRCAAPSARWGTPLAFNRSQVVDLQNRRLNRFSSKDSVITLRSSSLLEPPYEQLLSPEPDHAVCSVLLCE